MDVSEKDWKLFRKMAPVWEEAFMDRLNRGYIALLSSDKPAGEKFWELENWIKQDKHRPGVALEMRRSRMDWTLCDLILDGSITVEDLAGFSKEIRSQIDVMLKSADFKG